jgi:hypothetical protein
MTSNEKSDLEKAIFLFEEFGIKIELWQSKGLWCFDITDSISPDNDDSPIKGQEWVSVEFFFREDGSFDHIYVEGD